MSFFDRNLSNLKVSESFYRLMQTDPTDDKTLIDGTGSLVTELAVSGTIDAFYFRGDGSQLFNISTASLPAGLVSSSAQLGLSSTDSPTFAGLTVQGILTAEQYVISSSVIYVTQSFSSGSTVFGNSADDTHQFTGSVFIEGPLTVIGGITGSLFGTSSWSTYSITSSIANTASYIDPLFISASVAAQGLAGTSDWDQITNKPANLISGSGQLDILGLSSTDSPTFANGNFTGNVVVGGTLTAKTYIISSSVINYQTIQVSGSSKFGDSQDDTHQFTGSLFVTDSILANSFTGSLEGTSSYALTASYALNANFDTGSFATTGSNLFKGDQVISGSIDITGSLSLTGSAQISEDLTVLGRITAQEFYTEFVSSSIIYESGSTKFGDSSDDVHQFTGSISVSGSLIVPESTLPLSATIGSLAISGSELWIYM